MLSFFFTFQISAQDTLMPVIFLDDIVISEENEGTEFIIKLPIQGKLKNNFKA